MSEEAIERRAERQRSELGLWVGLLVLTPIAVALPLLTLFLFDIPWREPSLRWLIFALPLLADLPVLAWLMRRRATRRVGQEEVARGLVAGRSAALRAVRAVLLLAGLALAILALAGPRYGSRTRVLRKRGIDLVVALDFSKSMLARDVRPNRIDRAKAELVRFLDSLEGDRVGIVAFAGETMEFPMTVDYAALNLFFRDLGPYDMPVGGTAIARALIASKRLILRASDRPGVDSAEEEATRRARVVVLVTDGEDHEGDPIEAARELAEAGIKIFVIGIGSRAGEPIPTYAPDGTWTGYLRDEEGELVRTALTEENEAQLRQIAEVSGGRYFRARRGGVGIDEIRQEIRRMHQAEHQARRITVHEERYTLLLLPAFLLLLLQAILPEAWIGGRIRRRAPTDKRARRGAGRRGSAREEEEAEA